MLNTLFIRTLIFSQFVIYLIGCTTTQYIPESNSNSSEKNLATIIVSKNEDTKLFSVDQTKVNSRIIMVNPGKHKITYGESGVNPEWELMEDQMTKNGFFLKGNVFVKSDSLSQKQITADPIGGLPERITMNPISKENNLDAGKIYGFRKNSLLYLNTSPVETHEWRGFTLGLVVGGVTFALIEGIRSSKEQDEMMKKTGDINYKLPYNYGTVIAGTLISAASGYLLGLLWKTIEY